MQVDTGEFRALRAEVAELAEQMREITVREIAAEHFFNAGRAFERESTGQHHRARRARHLRSVSDGAS